MTTSDKEPKQVIRGEGRIVMSAATVSGVGHVSPAASHLIGVSKPEYETPIIELDTFLKQAPDWQVAGMCNAVSGDEAAKVCGKHFPVPVPMIIGLAKLELDRRGKRSERSHGYWRILAAAAVAIAGAAIGKYIL